MADSRRTQSDSIRNEQDSAHKTSRIEAELRKAHEELGQSFQVRTAELHLADQQLAAEIVERQRMEEALRRSEEYFRALIEDGSDLIAILGVEGTIKYASPSHKRLLGYESEDLLGKEAFSFIHSEDVETVIAALTAEVQETASRGSIEFRFRHKNGAWHVLESTGRNLLDSPTINGILINSRDITERARMEEEKQLLQAQLAQAQKLQSLGTLAGGVAHDFNNLLTPIIGFGELLKKAVSPGTVAWDNLQEVLKAGQRAKELVQQLLAFSRPTQQTQVPVVLNEVVKDCLALLRAGLPSTIELYHTFDPAAGMVLADPTQLHQVIMNLGVNALQALEGQRGRLEIFVRQEVAGEKFAVLHLPLVPGSYCTLVVHDTGCGISPDVQARIFDPFFTTKDVGKGSGLGLSVVHGIVSNHGGAILVESAPGKGSTFTVYLPRIETPVTLSLEEPRPLAQRNGRILIVDDASLVAQLTRQMLKELGYDAISLTDSQEALTLLRQDPRRFDILITDQIMPGLSGTELALAVRSLRPMLPIIIYSGSPVELPEELSPERGDTIYIKKPFTIEQLGQALQQLFQLEEEVRP
jgi:PAS domain S-box-containing protein